MPNIVDIFNNDAFSCQSMTSRANNPDIMPFVPGRAGMLGIFAEEGVTTTMVAVERRKGKLSLIPASARGSVPKAADHAADRSKLVPFVVPHFETTAAIMADTAQNLRAFGTTELATFQTLVDRRGLTMTRDHDTMLEYGRIGALQGQVLDADGATVLVDLWSAFGITQGVYDFHLGTDTTDVPGQLLQVKQDIEFDLGMQTYDHIHAFCSLSWYNKFVAHPKVSKAFMNYQQGAQQYISDKRKGFTFQDIVFEVYPGKVGDVSFIPDGDVRFFPVGVPGLFVTNFAPGDSTDAANTIGVPRYFRQEMMKFNKGVELLMESNPLSWCGQPEVLKRGHSSN